MNQMFSKSAKFYKILTACITMEVKNNHALVTTQRILNKLIEVNFSVGYRLDGYTNHSVHCQ